MKNRDELDTRMKENYEKINNYKLTRRTPVIIRIDGKAFHTFTKGFNKPFDNYFMKIMQETMLYLCKNIQGCVLGYTQSDEISLLLIDYKNLNSDAWFNYEVQKLCSISASMATLEFNKRLRINTYVAAMRNEYIKKALIKGAMFDSRCFNIPKEEVTNYFYWRQLDAMRNSVQMVGHKYFSDKQLQNKSCNDIKEMLINNFKLNWENYTIPEKRGTCCINDDTYGWILDKSIPIFKGDNRNYIDKLVYNIEEETETEESIKENREVDWYIFHGLNKKDYKIKIFNNSPLYEDCNSRFITIYDLDFIGIDPGRMIYININEFLKNNKDRLEKLDI